MVGHTDTHTQPQTHKRAHTHCHPYKKCSPIMVVQDKREPLWVLCLWRSLPEHLRADVVSSCAVFPECLVTLKHTSTVWPVCRVGGSHVDGHGSWAAPYSWAQPIKLIINLSQGLAGVADWRSRAGRRPENRTIDRISAAVRERPRSPGGRLELKPGPGSTRPSPTLFFYGAVETLYEGPCHQTHV